MILLIGNDCEIVIDALRLSSDDSYVNDATLIYTLYDSTGAVVSSLSGVSVTYVAASNGDYRGVIPGTATLTENAAYRILVTSSNYSLRWEAWVTAQRRTS